MKYRSIRMILIAIPVVVLFWLITKDFAFSGKLSVAYDFSHDSPFVKRLWPPGRLRDITYDKKTHDYFQRMFVEPVTFDVRLPRKFQAATVDLVYKKDEAQPLRLGVRLDPEKWSWAIYDVKPISQEGEWMVGRVRFDDLTTADFSGQKLHFLVNAPGLFEAGREITLTEIRVTVEKEPITLNNFFPRFWHWLWN